MKESRNTLLNKDFTILILLALVRLILHTATNGQYGFHRDELAMLDDARHLAWGYVAYPPLVPFLTRIGWELFGASLPGLRLFSVIVQCVAMVLVGLMAVLLAVTRGRFYYLAPAFPMLLAAGAVVGVGWLSEKIGNPARVGWGFTWIMLAVGAVMGGVLMLPIHAVGSGGWDFAYEVHDNFAEMIGWPELVAEVAEIYEAQPEGTGILASNYGEAGAVALYGPDYGLPNPISGMNSFWARGYGNPPTERLIVLGASAEDLEQFFESCSLAGHTPNPYGVENEETKFHPDIFVCEGLQMPWEVFWERVRGFG